jgi:hypothetical protein
MEKSEKRFENVGSGIVRRRQRRVVGVFIDGTGLDRATRRIARKVDLSRLLRGVSLGTDPVVARYYTIIPFEDDSRHRAFLDAVERSGLSVVVKRLPPKGISRQVTTEVEMASDMIAFAQGFERFASFSQDLQDEADGRLVSNGFQQLHPPLTKNSPTDLPSSGDTQPMDVKRILIAVCPERDLVYPITLADQLGAEVHIADFGKFIGGGVLSSAAQWIDLSDSETIWRE